MLPSLLPLRMSQCGMNRAKDMVLAQNHQSTAEHLTIHPLNGLRQVT